MSSMFFLRVFPSSHGCPCLLFSGVSAFSSTSCITVFLFVVSSNCVSLLTVRMKNNVSWSEFYEILLKNYGTPCYIPGMYVNFM